MRETITLSKSTYSLYATSAKLEIYEREVSISLLKDLLGNPDYYDILNSIYEGTCPELEIVCTDIIPPLKIVIPKKCLIAGFTYLNKHNMLDPKAKECYQKLNNKIPFANFLHLYEDQTFDITIDNINYHISISSIINFLSLSSKEFRELCTNKDITEINGIPKSHFIYTARTFEISDRYDIPDIIIENQNELRKFIIYDSEAINLYTENKGEIIAGAKVNPLMRASILEGMPETYNVLEKAIYIYIRMCELLSYDEEYFAADETGAPKEKHSDINRVSEITPANNLVVCYEFTAIYAKMLEELGINYEIVSSVLKANYGAGHQSLRFRIGKFLIAADAVHRFFKSDLYYTKVGKIPSGFDCLNENEETSKELYEIVIRINDEYQSSRHNDDYFKNVVSMYRYLHYKDIPLPSLSERIEMLLTKLTTSKLSGIDRLSYILDLYGTMFSTTEKRENFIISIIHNKSPEDKTKEAAPEVIITINEVGVYENPENTSYFILKENNTLYPVSKEFLMSKFYSETYSYTESTDHLVPGI